jgi:hypothetical protein
MGELEAQHHLGITQRTCDFPCVNFCRFIVTLLVLEYAGQ